MPAQDPSSSSLNPAIPEDAELIDFFVENLPERIITLRKAISEEDMESITRLAHQLKGSAPSYGFPQIGNAAPSLEQSVHATANASVQAVRAEIDALIKLCESYAKDS